MELLHVAVQRIPSFRAAVPADGGRDEAAPEKGAWAEPAGEDPEPEADEGVAAPVEDEPDEPVADQPVDEEQ